MEESLQPNFQRLHNGSCLWSAQQAYDGNAAVAGRNIACIRSGCEPIHVAEADYIAITRLDSDDLMHRTAMEVVRDNLLLSEDAITKTIFRTAFHYDILNGVIGTFHRLDSPFVTHVVPKTIYKNWPVFFLLHHVKHGRLGGRDPNTVELPQYKICVVKHENNICNPQNDWTYSAEQRRALLVNGQLLAADKLEVAAILRDFGVSPEDWRPNDVL